MTSSDGPPGWAEDELSKFFETTYRQWFATFANLNDEFQNLVCVDDIFLKVSHNWKDPDNRLIPFLFYRTLSAFRAASSHACSGQLSEAYPLMRLCLEASAYSLLMHDNEELCRIWLNRHDDDESLKKARNAFSSKNLKKCMVSYSQNLADKYETLYQKTIDFGGHPNEKSITEQIFTEKKSDTRYIGLTILSNRPDDIRKTMHASASCALLSLEIFKQIYQDRFDETGASESLDILAERLSVVGSADGDC